MEAVLRAVLTDISTRYTGPPLSVTEISETLGHDYGSYLWNGKNMDASQWMELLSFWRSEKGFIVKERITQRTRSFEIVDREKWDT